MTWRLVALGILLVGTGGWAFHNRLTKSAPEKDQVITASPEAIRLWFAEEPEVVLSSITLRRADKSKVSVGKLQKTDDPKSIRVAVPAALKPGVFTVEWKTSGKDGHVIRGAYSFTLKQ